MKISHTTAELSQVQYFQYYGLTLNFDLDLWKVNNELLHRCLTSAPNFMKIRLLVFEKSQQALQTNEPCNKEPTNQQTNTVNS